MPRPKNPTLCTGRPRTLPWEAVRAAIRGGNTYRHAAWKFRCSLGAIHRIAGDISREASRTLWTPRAPLVISPSAAPTEWLRALHRATEHLRPSIREDVRQELALAILSGDVRPDQIQEAIPAFARRAAGAVLTEENPRFLPRDLT